MSSRWYTLSVQEVIAKLQTDSHKGLSDKEAKERELAYGPNQLARAPRDPAWKLFLAQFKDFMVLVLLAATAISGLLGEYADAITIAIIVMVNAVLGFIQEYRAERSLEALKKLTSPEARVIRNGQERKLPAAALVPGDIVMLEEGDRIPADMRLLHTASLEIEESALTGESLPVLKQKGALPAYGLAPGDATNMAYFGTVATRGRGMGVVVTTGMATEMGQIAGMIQQVDRVETPLQHRLAQLGRWLVAFCLFICAVVVLLGIMRGEEAYQMFLAGVSLAVAAIPEGLPAIVTVALALGVQRMIKRQAVIRKLPAVETLGCSTVICSDKTGTLTQNEMTVRRIVINDQVTDITGEGYDPKGEFAGGVDKRDQHFNLLMKAAALCNNSVLERGRVSIKGLFRAGAGARKHRGWSVLGDPTEGALLVMAAKAGIWREKLETKEIREEEIPFDSDRKRMSVLYRQPDGALAVYTKGAPDVILDLCTHSLKGGMAVPLSKWEREEILRQNAELAEQALRVIAFAYREMPAGDQDFSEENVEQRLIFVGMAGMIDPPRPAAVKAVHTCRRAGIKVVMITGDHKLTAQAIAREMSILSKGGKVLTGSDLDTMSDQEFAAQVEKVSVYARVSPRHKLKIVQALKQAGHVVAMTGDGVNDAPAIKEADIGIAMGISGTDVTKEASAMVLTDDNFSSIVAAIEEGRGIYDNIRKFIRYLLSCNVGEIMTMFVALLAGMPLPLLPIQILWMNLVTDGLPAMALGVDPHDSDIMTRRPRHPKESVFAHGMTQRIIINGTVIGLGALLAFRIGLFMGEVELARTMAFNALVMFQLFYVFSCRSESHTILEVGLFTNPYLLGAVFISGTLQMLINYVPFLQNVFHVVPLSGMQWLIILVISAAPTVLGVVYHHLRGSAKKKVMYLKV